MSKYIGEGVCGSVMAIATITQTNEYLQTIQLVICIVSGLIGLALVLWKLLKTYKDARKDGKITAEEQEKIDAEKQEAFDKGYELGKQMIELVEKVKNKQDKRGD